jgi:hypothetical protein
MATVQHDEPLRLPASLRRRLQAFRRRVATIKMAEAIGVAIVATIAAFLCVFGLDRLADTPGWMRACILAAALAGCAVIPLHAYRWIWKCRCLEQISRLLSHKLPRLGDQLLGVVELVSSDGEYSRSRALCVAAIRQVAADAKRHNFAEATPNSRYRAWGTIAVVGVAAAVTLGMICPLAAENAWIRFLTPWSDTPRYTFAAIEPLPAEIVVAHGEPFHITVSLMSDTAWLPAEGRIRVGRQEPIVAALEDGRYQFDVPPQITGEPLDIRVGDARQTVRLSPLLRPELTAITADVALPDYLGRPKREKKDVRGGSVSLVKGSRAVFVANASRPLAKAQVNGRAETPTGATIRSPEMLLKDAREIEFRWEDEFALQGKEPFTLKVAVCDDEAPSLACEDLPRMKVVLDSEQLRFLVKAQDDFGVKTVGIEWRTPDGLAVEKPIHGERIVAAGGHEKTLIDARATFSAKTLGIEPQTIELRAYAEDFFPGRPRVYSSAATLYVLDPVQHAIWLTEQLSRWHRQSLEVRDHEKRLHETNKQLRDLPADELDRPATRRRIEQQASAERANGRRLESLVATGEDLVRQASRNPEFAVGHLERWAEMLQILKDIAANRMPSVADLLRRASDAKPSLATGPKSNSATAGQTRSVPAGQEQANSPPKKDASPSKTPKVADAESSQQPNDGKKSSQGGKSNSKPSLRLATTTLFGKGPNNTDASNPPSSEAGQAMDNAVRAQEDLLAEFEKVANELNNVLANLEGSTLVKRLKAAAREQYRIAGRIGDQLDGAFGSSDVTRSPAQKKVFADLSTVESGSSQNASLIMDDIQAYFERRQFVRFKAVLDEMKTQDVVGSLRQLGGDMADEPGLSIAQCEFWSDTLDRWAEDLVEVTRCGQCSGSCSSASLPPSIVLEVLHILEGEVSLREDTRVAEQAKAAETKAEHRKQANKLTKTQDGLRERTVRVKEKIGELPDAQRQFGREMALLGAVADVMSEASEILAQPETGRPAIGAETEAIELLLQSRRVNPRGGGGGGATPGGGGTGTTSDSALNLLGIGVNEKEVRAHRAASQAVGESGRSLPEEFRSGLNEYFHRLEQQDRK